MVLDNHTTLYYVIISVIIIVILGERRQRMARTITYRNDMQIIKDLVQKDPLLKPLFETQKKVVVTLSDNYFLSLVSAILSQQLSGKVAAVIYQRVLNYFDKEITPQNIIDVQQEDLRALGVSYQKISYLKSLAQHMLDGEIHLDALEKEDNELIIEQLTKVKGIGRWTAHMFLMFSLGREDVSAPLDLGLRKAYSQLKGEEVSVEAFLKISKTWQPYRSVVCHFLWQSTDES